MKSGNQTLRLFPGAMSVLQSIHAGKFPGRMKSSGRMRLAIASSAITPKAVEIAKAAMEILEIVPGRVCRLCRLT